MVYVRRSESTSIFGQMLFDVTQMAYMHSDVIYHPLSVNSQHCIRRLRGDGWGVEQNLICYNFRLVICFLKRV